MTANSTPKTVLVDSKSYEVLAVKEGGMGRVWILRQQFDEAFDPIYRRNLAVKTFDFVRDQSAIEQELNVWISLAHPSVLPLKKIGRLNYRLAAIMPFMPGTLDDDLEEIGCIPEADVVKVLAQVADALAYAWSSHKILHLDIKPSNILLKDPASKIIQVADWGISRLAMDRTIFTRTPTAKYRSVGDGRLTSYLAGTPLYMSPERFSGAWNLDPTVDIYSLGMLAIHLLHGTLPFRFGEVDPFLEIQSGAYVENAASVLEGSTGGLRELILRCIQPKPASRPRSFDQLISELNRLN